MAAEIYTVALNLVLKDASKAGAAGSEAVPKFKKIIESMAGLKLEISKAGKDQKAIDDAIATVNSQYKEVLAKTLGLKL